MSLEGKVVLCTGVTGNVGWGVAHAARDAGARLVVPVRRADAQREVEAELGSEKVWAPLVDVGEQRSLERAAAEALERFGAIDHVVAPLGAWWQKGASLDQPLSELRALLSVTIEAPWLLLKTMAPALRTSQGSFTFITGTAGEQALIPGAGLLVAAVGGQFALSRTMRAELAREPFRVNEIRIRARVEREPRPGVVLSRAFGKAALEVLQGDGRGLLYRFGSDARIVVDPEGK